MGGVSSWCDDLVRGLDEIDWRIVPITAGGLCRDPLFDLPRHVTMEPGIELWSRPGRRRGAKGPDGDEQRLLPARMCRFLLGGTDHQVKLVDLLRHCRESPSWARAAFKSKPAWTTFLQELQSVTRAEGSDLFGDVQYTALEATELWQTLYWLVNTAAAPLPESDVLLLTAAGWGGAMAAAEKSRSGVPVVLAEHGIYVREAYLAAARTGDSPGRQFTRTRLARGLARLSYAVADKITPVSDAHHSWESSFGVPAEKLHTITNGVPVPATPAPPGVGETVCTVGRVDPLKDVVTMLRTAAALRDLRPGVKFIHWGPVSPENETYYRMCLQLHEELGLGDSFEFMGPTRRPRQAMREADIYLNASISEGLPLSVLEAMSEARPVVVTNVGGCAQAIEGCGLIANAGDHFSLAHALAFLLERPDFAALMGRRGFRRAKRLFSAGAQIDKYRDVLERVAG